MEECIEAPTGPSSVVESTTHNKEEKPAPTGAIVSVVSLDDTVSLSTTLAAVVAAAGSKEEVAVLLPPLANAVRTAGSSLDLLRVCEAARASRATLDAICACAGDTEPKLHQAALILLATLTTEAIDPMASESASTIKENAAFGLIASIHLFADAALTVALACGCVQNMVADIENAAILHSCGGVSRLRMLVASPASPPALAAAARACLRNLFLFEQAQPPPPYSSGRDAASRLQASDVGTAAAPASWHRAATKLQVGALRRRAHVASSRATKVTADMQAERKGAETMRRFLHEELTRSHTQAATARTAAARAEQQLDETRRQLVEQTMESLLVQVEARAEWDATEARAHARDWAVARGAARAAAATAVQRWYVRRQRDRSRSQAQVTSESLQRAEATVAEWEATRQQLRAGVKASGEGGAKKRWGKLRMMTAMAVPKSAAELKAEAAEAAKVAVTAAVARASERAVLEQLVGEMIRTLEARGRAEYGAAATAAAESAAESAAAEAAARADAEQQAEGEAVAAAAEEERAQLNAAAAKWKLGKLRAQVEAARQAAVEQSREHDRMRKEVAASEEAARAAAAVAEEGARVKVAEAEEKTAALTRLRMAEAFEQSEADSEEVHRAQAEAAAARAMADAAERARVESAEWARKEAEQAHARLEAEAAARAQAEAATARAEAAAAQAETDAAAAAERAETEALIASQAACRVAEEASARAEAEEALEFAREAALAATYSAQQEAEARARSEAESNARVSAEVEIRAAAEAAASAAATAAAEATSRAIEAETAADKAREDAAVVITMAEEARQTAESNLASARAANTAAMEAMREAHESAMTSLQDKQRSMKEELTQRTTEVARLFTDLAEEQRLASSREEDLVTKTGQLIGARGKLAKSLGEVDGLREKVKTLKKISSKAEVEVQALKVAMRGTSPARPERVHAVARVQSHRVAAGPSAAPLTTLGPHYSTASIERLERSLFPESSTLPPPSAQRSLFPESSTPSALSSGDTASGVAARVARDGGSSSSPSPAHSRTAAPPTVLTLPSLTSAGGDPPSPSRVRHVPTLPPVPPSPRSPVQGDEPDPAPSIASQRVEPLNLRPSTAAISRGRTPLPSPADSPARFMAARAPSPALDTSTNHHRSDELASQIKLALEKASVRTVELFRKFDADSSGAIDQQEFESAVRALGVEASSEEVGELLMRWDLNSDGSIDYKEMDRSIRNARVVQQRPPPPQQSPPQSPRASPSRTTSVAVPQTAKSRLAQTEASLQESVARLEVLKNERRDLVESRAQRLRMRHKGALLSGNAGSNSREQEMAFRSSLRQSEPTPQVTPAATSATMARRGRPSAPGLTPTVSRTSLARSLASSSSLPALTSVRHVESPWDPSSSMPPSSPGGPQQQRYVQSRIRRPVR